VGDSVAILGGGVAGLSAAHELAERGFDVTVYEARLEAGGKARSMPVPGSGTAGRDDLPAEHGFRFFPGFYRHLPDTMRRIPVDGRADGVAGNLVGSTRVLLAQAQGRNEVIGPARAPRTVEDLTALTRFLRDWALEVGVPLHEQVAFTERLLTLLTSCDERRFEQWEQLSWWEFSGAERRSAAFGKFLADGLTRSLVAARAREMSARTGGYILLQLLFDLTRHGGNADRVLNAPTNDAWITPWIAHLEQRGVKLRFGAPVVGIECVGRRIASVSIAGGEDGSAERVEADHYVAALPVEQLRLLVSPQMRRAEPRLARLDRLVTRWMNGIMFYLDEDVSLVHGHAIYIDSEWSLTSISQAQFWDVDLQRYGDGRVQGILSVDVSEWERPSTRTGKVATMSSSQEIRAEVWAQLKDHLDDGVLRDENVIASFLDPAILFPNPTSATNLEPLLVNTAGSWHDRPDAATRITNLYLASDFVRTHTDLATMEGANEAARRAVNAILERSGSRSPRCGVWPLQEPAIFAAARAADKLRWKALRRNAKPLLRVTPEGALQPTGPLARILVDWLPRIQRAARRSE
jgi:uncharacterized protein with NAD-binding domain and iron-sulfur cluster